MTDDTKMAGGVPWPNMEDEARIATRKIYQLGALHAVHLLRGTDIEGIPDAHIDRIANFIEANVGHSFGPTAWPLPDWWDGE